MGDGRVYSKTVRGTSGGPGGIYRFLRATYFSSEIVHPHKRRREPWMSVPPIQTYTKHRYVLTSHPSLGPPPRVEPFSRIGRGRGYGQ